MAGPADGSSSHFIHSHNSADRNDSFFHNTLALAANLTDANNHNNFLLQQQQHNLITAAAAAVAAANPPSTSNNNQINSAINNHHHHQQHNLRESIPAQSSSTSTSTPPQASSSSNNVSSAVPPASSSSTYHNHHVHHHPHHYYHHANLNHHHYHHQMKWLKDKRSSASQSSSSSATTSNNAQAISSSRRGQGTSTCTTTTNSSIMIASTQSLLDLSAKIVAEHIPFQSIEQRYEHIPEPVQRRIIFWSFPRHEDDIKMYSSLTTSSDLSQAQSQATSSSTSNQTTQSPSLNNNNANQQNRTNFPWPNAELNNQQAEQQQATNGSNNTLLTVSSSGGGIGKNQNGNKQLTFHKGLRLYNEGCVYEVLQVGFNLSGLISIKPNMNNHLSSNQPKIRGNQANNNYHNGSAAAGANNLPGGVAAAAAAIVAAAAAANANNLDQLPAAINRELNQQGQVNNNSTNDITPVNSNNTANNSSAPTKSYRVSVTFDRCKITSVSCSCELQDIFWCEHVVALILYRIRNPETIDLRVPISETLLSLDRQQLQKLVQYIIAEHHTEVLPTAQRLLDEMRQSFSEINQIQGAPDPTAGACADDEHIWHLDENQVNEKVQNYLNLVCNNSKDAVRQIHALFEKIREMFKAKDSNGTRLLKLITEQFLLFATKNDKSRPLWDQLVSLWVIVMLNPDLSKDDKTNFLQLLTQWSRVLKCPKEDVERRITIKRKAVELSDDEEADDYSPLNLLCNDYPIAYNQSNNYPAHMATHGYRNLYSVLSNNPFPLKFCNPILSSTCQCQLSHSIAKKMRGGHHSQHSGETFGSANDIALPSASSMYKQSSSSSLAKSYNSHRRHRYHHSHHNQASSSSRSSLPGQNENRPAAQQEPRSVFYRAIDFKDTTWDEPHLQLILYKDGPFDHDNSQKLTLFDYAGNPLWNEPISQAAARVETLKSHGYRDEALRLTVATIRRLKLLQHQWILATTSDSTAEFPCLSKSFENYTEGWIGHPLDPINVLLDILLEASMTDVGAGNLIRSNNSGMSGSLCAVNSPRFSCPCNQVLADFTQRLLPDLASLTCQHRVENFPILPMVNHLTSSRPQTTLNQASVEKTQYFHVPVPGCCQKDSYLTLGFEIALIALGQVRSIPSVATAHDRAVRQEAEIISKLESVDTNDSLIIEILEHQSTLLLEGGPFQNSSCGIPTDSAPLHTYARYLFDALFLHYPQLAYNVGVHALKMPLVFEENENFGSARTSPRTINYNHLQVEQLALAQTMLSKTKDILPADNQPRICLQSVYKASVKNIRNATSLLKLSKHVLREAKPPNSPTLHPALLKTSFDLGLQVLRLTLSHPHASNGKTRREAITFIVDCATDNGLDTVIRLMKDWRFYFSAIEALNLIVARDNDHVNLRLQAINKLMPKESPSREIELNQNSRDLVLDCASRDPTNCALEALKFCETDSDSLKKALNIIIEAGKNGAMDSTQLIKVADHIEERGMTEKAFAIAMVAADSLSIGANSDNSSAKKDIFRACEYAVKVKNGFSVLIPKLIDNIECATLLSDIYRKFSPHNTLIPPPNYRNFDYRGIDYNDLLLNRFKPEIYNQNVEQYKQKAEDAKWWDALLRKTLKAFVDITRNRLQSISPRHYGEFIEFLAKAKETFERAADGPKQFEDLIVEIMKTYKTKKKLMERLKARVL